MFATSFFFRMPEQYYFINFIPGFSTNSFTPVMKLGIILMIACFLVLIIFKFKKPVYKNAEFNSFIICLILISQVIIYANFFFNNLLDWRENLERLNYDYDKKIITRSCAMDVQQNWEKTFCHLFPFIGLIKKSVNDKAIGLFAVNPRYTQFFSYYLYPDFKFSNQADYLIYYYPDNYFYDHKQQALYQKNNNLLIGNYDLFKAFNQTEMILKK